jgi:hypothetical protein
MLVKKINTADFFKASIKHMVRVPTLSCVMLFIGLLSSNYSFAQFPNECYVDGKTLTKVGSGSGTYFNYYNFSFPTLTIYSLWKQATGDKWELNVIISIIGGSSTETNYTSSLVFGRDCPAGSYTSVGAVTKTVTSSACTPCQIAIGSVTVNNPYCPNTSQGDITVGYSGKNQSYVTLAWTSTNGNGSATSTSSSSIVVQDQFKAGSYTFTLYDGSTAATCKTASFSRTFVDPDPTPTWTLTPHDLTCYESSDGSITASVSMTRPPYTYKWSGPSGYSSTAASLTGLSAGGYFVTITDDCGLSYSKSTVVGTPDFLTVSILSYNNVTCNGENDGSVTVAATGGTTGYSYAWSGGGTDATKTGLSPGGHTVTVTDFNHCSSIRSVTITQPNTLTCSTNQTNISCNGANDGIATVVPIGGTTSYNYNWTGGGANATISSLAPGAYSVTVTDFNSCTSICSVTITQPTILTTTISQTNISCNGANDGTATVTASGGTTNYSYAWSGGGTDATKTGLSPGGHSVTVTDFNQCTSIRYVTITQPLPFEGDAVVTEHVICNGGNNGAVEVTCIGCSAPSYLWDGPGSFTSTDQNLSGLKAGKYSVTITDLCGIYSELLTITQPKKVKAICSTTSPSCKGDGDGTASVTASEGTGPYSYLWSSGQSTSTITGLTAGSYEVTVTDDCHSVTCIATVEEPDKFIAYCIVSRYGQYNIACKGASNGSIEVITIGGNAGPGTTYSWNPSSFSGDYLTNLDKGQYYITVSDPKGCKSNIGPIVMAEPATAISVGSISQTEVKCYGGADGSATIAVSGGSGNYSYLWNNGQKSASATGLSAGTYSVTINDNGGCAQTNSVVVTEPTQLTISPVVFNVDCYGKGQGEIYLNTNNATPNYSYQWFGADFNGKIYSSSSKDKWLNRKAGNYCVTITDANGCDLTECFEVQQPTQLLATVNTITKPNCNGGSDGSVTMDISGGRPSYTYNWSNGASTKDINLIPADKYYLTVTDGNDCILKKTIIVREPNLLTLASSVVNPSCGSTDGSITISPNGGTGSKSYNWSGTNASGKKANNLAAGAYSVTVTDNNGCEAILNETLICFIPKAVNSNELTDLQVFPNPTFGSLTISIANGFKGDKAYITDITGKIIEEKTLWGKEESLDIGLRENGTYFILLEIDGVVLQKRIVLIN